MTGHGVKQPIAWIAIFFALSVLLHVRTFTAPHVEGDELAYRALSQEMGWDISHYTTRDHPQVSQYPSSIYRQPLFHQPPLYPLVLKAGALVGSPVAAGLLFQILAMGLLLASAARASKLLELTDTGRVVLLACLTLCPMLLFSTTRLHHDGLLAIFLFAAFTMLLEALDERSTRKSVVSGLLFALALNVRFKGLTALPLVLGAQLFFLYRLGLHPHGTEKGSAAASFRDAARRPENWRCFAIVAGLIALLGLPHYVRILATYGSLLPGAFMATDPDLARSTFLSNVVERSRPRVFAYLLLMFPLLLGWLSPANLSVMRSELAGRRWGAFYVAAGLYFLVVCLAGSHQQLRYFAVMTPFLYVTFALWLDRTPGRPGAILLGAAALTFLLMALSGILYSVLNLESASLIPALFILIPQLRPLYL